MKIIRDGREYELTRQEMWDAFEEQQHKYDIDDVESVIHDTYDADDFFETFGITQEQAEANIDRIAYRKRKYQDEYDNHWDEAAKEAIEYYADEIKEQEAV